MSKIREFIDNNGLSFEEGSRNTTVVTLVGYAQHLGITENKLKAEVVDEIDADSFIGDEISRIWEFCKIRNYKDFWSTPKAKKLYKF